MKITYIKQSGFYVELKKTSFLFDYYKGEVPKFPADKHVYICASHKHSDHFSKKIFNFIDIHPNTSYILSYDIKEEISPDILERFKNNLFFIKANEEKHFINGKLLSNIPESNTANLVKVKALDSTDLGVAFLVNCENKIFFHAGDLNWWTWEGESNKEYKDMTDRFHRIVSKLKQIPIDFAFLPLDPRQGERFYWGFDYFMKRCIINIVFPMHFWKDFSVIPKLMNLQEAEEYKSKVVVIEEEHQEFILK